MENLSKIVVAICIAFSVCSCNNNNKTEIKSGEKTQNPSLKTKAEITQILDSLKSDTQIFEIDPAKTTVITGKLGTKISIPANSLINTNKHLAKGKATLYLKESYTLENFVGDNLSTITENHQQLETAGMVNIQVKQGDDILFMRSHTTYKVYITNKDKNLKPDYKAFYQSINKDGVVEWKEAEVQNPDLKPINLTVEYDNARRKVKVQTGSYFEKRYYSEVLEDEKSRYWRLSSNCTELNEKLIKQFKDIDKIMYLYNSNDSIVHFKIKLEVDNLGKIQNYIISPVEQLPLLSKYFKHIICNKINKLDYKKISIVTRIDSTEWLKYGNYFRWNQADFKVNAAKLLNEFRAKIKDFSEIENSKNDITEYSASQYIMNLNQFGWINLDRYINNQNGNVDLQLVTNEKDCKVYVLFKNINSLIQSTTDQNIFKVFKGMPKNENVKIMALKIINGTPCIAIKDEVIGDKSIVMPAFTATTLARIKEELR